jgi:hypothetical protein
MRISPYGKTSEQAFLRPGKSARGEGIDLDRKRGILHQRAYRELKTFAEGRKEVSLTVDK